jgi:hypothetical protein
MDEKRDYPNSGILFRVDRKDGPRDRDYRGSCDITCSCGKRTQLWLSGWVKEGRRGKFIGLAFKAKGVQSDTSDTPAPDADIDDLFN